MKIAICSLILASALAAPVASFAQTANDPVSRSDVRAQIVEAEKNGTLHQSRSHYPDQQKSPQAAATVDTTSYGAPMTGSTQSREVLSPEGQSRLYSHR